MACKTVKNKPNKMVRDNESEEFFFSPQMIEKCAQVTVIPELSNTIVFNNGMEKGFKAKMPLGGHRAPISKVGARLL